MCSKYTLALNQIIIFSDNLDPYMNILNPYIFIIYIYPFKISNLTPGNALKFKIYIETTKLKKKYKLK